MLGPPQIGLLAAIGRGTVTVRPRPRVVVLSTGSELVQPGEELGAGQIYDSNSFALAAAARDAGAIAYRVGAVTDDAAVLRDTIEDQLIRADLWSPPAGSASARTTSSRRRCPRCTRTRRAAASTSASWRCSPASPRASARSAPTTPRCSRCPATRCRSYVSFELFVRPAIRTLMGLDDVHRPTVARRSEHRQGAHLARRAAPVPARHLRRRRRAPSARSAAPDRT